MSRTTFIAQAPDGSIHTRTSENRTYTHAIIVRASFDFAMARADRDNPQDAKDWVYHSELAAGTHEHCAWLKDRHPEQIEQAKYLIRQCPTADEYVALQRKERVARLRAAKAPQYHAVTWCGRPDLAQKAAARENHSGREVHIVAATVKGGAK